MTDSNAPGFAPGQPSDPRTLAPIERWYREHCPPVAEICIVALAENASPRGHLHAIIVPDFAQLKERREPNARELLRFEFQQASKQLAIAARPHTFSIRSRPLPRTLHGEPDRERLRSELSEPEDPPREPPPLAKSPVEESVCRVIHTFRPGAGLRPDTSLELELGFDSLERIQLICSVEKALQLAIPAAQAATIFTVGDLAAVAAPHAAQARAPHPSGPGEVEPVDWEQLLSRPLEAGERKLADSILKHRPALSLMAWGAARLSQSLFGRRFQFLVEGGEQLPRQGACLLVANHCSHLDPLFLLWAMPFHVARRVSFMGHTEYFGSGWKAALATRLKLVPVDPGEHALEGVRLCAEALRRGYIGAVFPEGERSPDGAQQRFHPGIALLARQLRLPIVPAAISGTYDVLPRGRQQIRRAPVQVRFGAPLFAESGETEQNLLARAWAAVARLRGADNRSREPVPRPLEIQTNFQPRRL